MRMVIPKTGTGKVKTVFLWFPMKARNDATKDMEWRWLERAKVVYMRYNSRWCAERFLD